MKGYCIILLFITLVVQSNGQTFSEWFRQKKTQKKYLIEQITALHVYAGYLEKGYAIVHAGLSQIRNIEHGGFGLHERYFKSLKTINSRVRNYKVAGDIIGLKLEIESISRTVLKEVKTANMLNSDQTHYISVVFNKLIEGCDEDLEVLLQLLTPNLLALKDNERLKKIDGLYDDMQERYLFARSFANTISQMQLSKSLEAKEIEAMRKVFDIKK
ncbi:hypothetical protein [Segetibacter koreensis]|uniref:hypothetical protein n=1 Tax=Segetibacter koreensis TaxID=398037 RepID=UPI000374EE60|nr:hypothetical protein [Segetibacter koreensis]